MKTYQLIGLSGCIILLISSFIPLAEISGEFITVIPVYGNTAIGDNVWVWKDVSAFAVTFAITIFLSIYFILKKMRIGILISTSLNLVVVIFIYISIWLTQLNVSDYTALTFSYKLNGFLLIAGLALVYYSAMRTPKKEKYTNS